MFGNLEVDIKRLLDRIEKAQWEKPVIKDSYFPRNQIITRDDLRKIKMENQI